ncbi:uncharacterized protein J4E79_000866 [Alternaria viburni]|uniref:uncharacterized protein n=1 Tax=Alternaria viburni TaxID=566460 RepID=UPI0020C4BB9C|nr:uncharacterized protein J4E79_000866 [Alternaria viburni]KAI4670580.1 hypothetical protein J4E79_000866 [Alternaria viburni]
MREELLETRQTLQDRQQQLQRALYEIGQLREDLRVAKTQHEGWRAFTASINTDPYAILKMQGLHKNLRYTELRKVDPSAAKAEMQVYEEYVQNLFVEKPHDIFPTVDMLINEIDFVEVKESGGDLRWRFDAALVLATQLHGALETYRRMKMRMKSVWDRNYKTTLYTVDIQFSLLILDINDNFGNDPDLVKAQRQPLDGAKNLRRTYGITEYYPESICALEKRIGRA